MGPLVPAATFTAAAIPFYNLMLARYDAVVALTLAVSTLFVALGGRYALLAYVSLGFGAACGATRLVLVHYADLLALRYPGPDLLLARNLLLVLL
jgi:hypothetical protein